MHYFVSDLHGEYGLFVKLLRGIDFCEKDRLFVLGDMIDKGGQSVRLMRRIASLSDSIYPILGNHELAFLKYYRSLLEDPSPDFEEILKKLQVYFPEGEDALDFELMDWLESLPLYIETEDFICVHAGLPLDAEGFPLPLCEAEAEQLVNDRRFKDPALVQRGEKCVLFGHTQTDAICESPRILGYRRDRSHPARSIRDFYKIHLDTGCFTNGVLGCFCLETLEAVYAKK